MGLSLPQGAVALLAVLAPFSVVAGADAAAEQPYIVVYKTQSKAVGQETTKDIVADRDTDIDPELRYGTAVQGFSADLTKSEVKDLKADPRVAAVAPDLPVQATGLVSLAGGDSAPSGIRRAGAATTTQVREASPVNVAVIDTGIDLDHPDLNAAAGRDCTGSGTTDDGNGHGTHVAGTIAAKNNGTGVTGVVPGTKVWAVRVLGSNGSGSTSGVICGIDWVTSTRKDTVTTNDISVANMSLGGRGAVPDGNCGKTNGDVMHQAICTSVAAGVTYVVAAGNDGADLQNSAPASYPEVLTVSSVSDSDGLPGGTGGSLSCIGNGDDTAASYSNYATRAADAAHLIAAPGSCITSTWMGGGYRTISGTSMATPHVAGLAALCIGDGATRGPCLGKTPAEIASILRKAAADQSAAAPSSGFAGDPTRPVSGRTYGYLASTRFSATSTTPTPPTPPVATAPVNTVKPAISGTAVVGQTLTATTGTWTGAAPITYALQWMRCTAASVTTCAVVAGATKTTLVTTTNDQNRQLRMRVTAKNAKGTVVVYSEPVVVAPKPAAPSGPPIPKSTPTISGTVAAGATLTANPGTWNGALPMTFTYYWASCAPGSNVCYFTGATGQTFTPSSAPAGTRFVFVVVARNNLGAAAAQSAVTGTASMSDATPSVVGLPAGVRR